MYEYHYERGIWRELPERLVDKDGSARKVGPELAEFGFDEHPYTNLGPGAGFSELELHPAADGSVEIPDGDGGMLRADFAVVLCPVEIMFVIYVRDLPSLLSLVGEAEALARLEALARASEEDSEDETPRGRGISSWLFGAAGADAARR